MVGLLITATGDPSVEMNLIFRFDVSWSLRVSTRDLLFFLLAADESVSIKKVNLCGISEVDFDGIKIVSKVPLQSVPSKRYGQRVPSGLPEKKKVRERELGLVRL